jgi:hypothetical protein
MSLASLLKEMEALKFLSMITVSVTHRNLQFDQSIYQNNLFRRYDYKEPRYFTQSLCKALGYILITSVAFESHRYK